MMYNMKTEFSPVDLHNEDAMAADITIEDDQRTQKYRVYWSYWKDYIETWAYNSNGNLITYLDAQPLRTCAPNHEAKDCNEALTPFGALIGAAYNAFELGFTANDEENK